MRRRSESSSRRSAEDRLPRGRRSGGRWRRSRSRAAAGPPAARAGARLAAGPPRPAYGPREAQGSRNPCPSWSLVPELPAAYRRMGGVRHHRDMNTRVVSPVEGGFRHPVCGFGAIAEAFAEASAGTGSCEELRQALDARAHEIDVTTAGVALRRLVGLLALKTGETPRSILEEEFARSPSDEFWRGTMGGP